MGKILKKLVKIITTTLATTGILLGTLVAAPVAMAEPAHAYTTSGCHQQWYNGWRLDTICYYDYNWWEESWMGGSRRDGWYRTGTTNA
jgi:hypothetical protein